MSTLVIGKNATCKTTLLRSIVIGLTDRAEGNALLAEEGTDLVGNKAKPAEIEIELCSNAGCDQKIITELECRDGHDEVVSQEPREFSAPFVCGYGVARSTSGSVEHSYRLANSTYTLFNYSSGLVEPELAIRRLRDFMDTRRYSRTLRGLKRAIGFEDRDKILLGRGGGVSIHTRSLGTIPLGACADGHRVPFNLILDVYGWAMRADAVTEDGGVHGVLLIDEIGQHLHPTLEADVLNRFQSLFRHTQLIATSHSPIVALGTQPEELVALRALDKYVEKIEKLPDYSTASAEDILVDKRLFDTPAYSRATRELRARYDALRQKPTSKLSRTEKAELSELARELATQTGRRRCDDPVVRELRMIRESLGD
jgi:hypothetical protein